MKNTFIIDKFIEKYMTIIISISILVISIIKLPKLITISKMDLMLSSVITITLTLIGILITALTILLAVMQTKAIKLLKLNLRDKLIGYIIKPIFIGFIMVIYLLYSIYIIKDKTIHKFDLTCMMVLLSMFICGVFRVGWVLGQMLKCIPHAERISDEQAIDIIDEDDFKSGM